MSKTQGWSGLLPSGKTTSSDSKYVKEWRAFAEDLIRVLEDDGERKFGVYSFDPDITLYERRSDGQAVNFVTLPLFIAKQIITLYKKLESAETLNDSYRREINEFYDD